MSDLDDAIIIIRRVQKHLETDKKQWSDELELAKDKLKNVKQILKENGVLI